MGRGCYNSSGGVKRILQSQSPLYETVFEMTEEGHVFAVRAHKLSEGFICATQDSDIHQISNLQPEGTDLITLYLYSPPLVVMGQYSLTDPTVNDYKDEVWDLVQGGGI
jgi:cysteine dioxygenase